MQYPKRIDQHVTETTTFKIFSNIIPDEWIIREMTERDYGIDCYIEICEKGCLTGKMLSVQLKGEKEIKTHNKNGFTYVADYDIKPSTFAYWYNLPVFVLFVFIDTSKNIVYFENIKKYIRSNYISFQNEELDFPLKGRQKVKPVINPKERESWENEGTTQKSSKNQL